MSEKIDFYAPYTMPAGNVVHGAAAAMARSKVGGGWNNISANMVQTGMKMGYQMAMRQKTTKKK